MAHRVVWAGGILLCAGVFAGCGGESRSDADAQDSAGAAGLPDGAAGSDGDTGGSGANTGGTAGTAGTDASTGGTDADTGGSGGDSTGGSGGVGGSTGGAGGTTGGTTGTAGSGEATAGAAGSGGSTGGTAGSTGGSAGAVTGGTAGSTGGSAGSITAGTAGSGAEAGQGGLDCAALSEAIAQQASGVTTCTAVVRLDYQTYEILAFQVLCGPYNEIDESTARMTAQDDTRYGLNGTLLSGDAPEDEYVFYDYPGDFGGVGVVSARSGLSVFGGSVIWSGTGEISYPIDWRPASEIGPDCIPVVNALPPTARGIDLSEGQGSLDETRVEAAVNQTWNTALPDGLWRGHYVFDAMVLLYPRTVGAFDPGRAEWIVMINSGWLE